jgi:hypothetical protein
MNCKYCNNPADNINQYKELNITVDVYKCELCQNRFIVADDTTLEVRLYCQVDKKRFCARFTYDDTYSKFEVFEMWNLDNFNKPPVISLNYFPDINPSNIKDKIKLLIPFA